VLRRGVHRALRRRGGVMARLPRFEEFRFIGLRDEMRVYDCDDDSEFKRVEQRISSRDLQQRDLLQTFAPDSLAEAANRGFRPV
jgi:hypothetical protein